MVILILLAKSKDMLYFLLISLSDRAIDLLSD